MVQMSDPNIIDVCSDVIDLKFSIDIKSNINNTVINRYTECPL